MLLSARFFRWKHVRALLAAELPRVQSVGGEFAGTRASIELARHQDDQLSLLDQRVVKLQDALDSLLHELRKGERHRL